MKELLSIQSELKVPKSQYNSFGKYKYRSCEDILEAVKPLLKQHGCMLNLCDEIVCIGDRYYVKSSATIVNESGESEVSTAYAREDQDKKGMDGAQITGTASSYARKYALNGLFCIDDTKDADTDEHQLENEQRAAKTPAPAPAPDPIPTALPMQPAPKKRVTSEMMDDPITSETFLQWAYKARSTVKNPSAFNAGEYMGRVYDTDAQTKERFTKLFASYVMTKEAK